MRVTWAPQGEAEGWRGVPGGEGQQPRRVDRQPGREERGAQGRHPPLPQEGQHLCSEVGVNQIGRAHV